MAQLVVNYTIQPGQSVRIGYKQVASLSDYTYVNYYPGSNESPFTISPIPSGSYQVQINTICFQCGGTARYSDPQVIVANTIL